KSAAASGAAASNTGNAAAATAPRRVSFGLIPDYAHQGAGVRAESVVPDSPAARAGFVTGDVLLEIDGKPVAGLAEFSEILKAYSPGAKISTVLQRGDRKQSVSVELTVR
ncbi:MAG: PDZ domain-containing protein, partial [Gammaproteobacteria bacterium]